MEGFTLIELMIVCLLVAILTAVIIPEMTGSYQDALLRATGRKLVDAFDLAYSRAVSLDQVDRVRLDPNTGEYVVERRVEQGGEEKFVAIKDGSGGRGELDGRISIEVQNSGGNVSTEAPEATPPETTGQDGSNRESADVFTFYPDGTAAGREVILRDQQGYGLALRINPITARVNLIELERQ